jgi:hypothetical protein
MGNETANRFAGAPDRRGHPRGSSSEQSPLQTRATFLKNRGWELVIGYNRGACARGGTQHGTNSESYAAVEESWRLKQAETLSFQETLDFLKSYHRRAPFLFFNGNTFADVGRVLTDYLFAELPVGRRREVMSAVAHYIAGVLDLQSMTRIIESLCESAEFKTGDRVKTLRGSISGVIVKILDDGKIVWQPDGTKSELTVLPESLLRED